MMGLLDRVDFAFQVNFHSFGPYLLYPEGWQTEHPDGGRPDLLRAVGEHDEPGDPRLQPGPLLGRALRHERRVDRLLPPPRRHARLDAGAGGGLRRAAGSCSRTTRHSCRPSSRRCCRSRRTSSPRRRTRRTRSPTSGSRRSRSTWRATTRSRQALPLANFKFAVSYGDPQTVRCWRSRDLGEGRAQVPHQRREGEDRDRRPNRRAASATAGRPTSTTTSSSGQVKGAKAGDTSRCGSRRRGGPEPVVHLPRREETKNRVLVVAAEDYSGASPVQTPGPHYLQYYLDALAANGIQADVYDVDANGRTAPDDLGVLSHYKAVIWYTGDDTVTREPGWGAGNASRLAMDEILNMREYMNEGGRVLFTGKNAGAAVHARAGHAALRPDRGERSVPRRPGGAGPLPRLVRLGRLAERRARVLVRRVRPQLRLRAGRERDPFAVNGVDNPFQPPLTWSFNGAGSADNQDGGELVHHDERDPAGGDVPAVQELAGREVRPAGRAVRPAHRRATTCTRRSPTSPTNG